MLVRPVIMAVDDDMQALAALLDALARRFGGDYRVVSHFSPDAALEDLRRMRDGEEPVALLIADQWMGEEWNGLKFLGEAHAIHPDAQRALMVDWGDQDGRKKIIQGCAFGVMDNYLSKPWSPPEVYLYPIISQFLSAWTQEHGPRMELVKVVGEERSPRSQEVQQLLTKNGIPFGFYTADSPKGQRLLKQTAANESALPVVVVLDGHAHVNPSNEEITDALGISNAEDMNCDVAIVGAGPAGLAAAVYASSEGLSTLVIEREAIGGQAGTSSLIRNYLGFPHGISGGQLTQRAYEQAWLFGAKYVFARAVNSLCQDGDRRILELSDGRQVSARSVILAMGATYRRLPGPNLARLEGTGVEYTALPVGWLIAGMDIFVAGAGNSAGQSAVHLAKYAKSVTMLVRADNLERSMSEYLINQIKLFPNIEVRFNTEVVDGDGERSLECLVLRDRVSGTTSTVDANLLFALIGSEPHTAWLGDSLQRDSKGFITTGPDLYKAKEPWSLQRPPKLYETSMPGVFAVGDVRHNSVKRIASAVGEGSVSVAMVHEYLAGN